MPLGPRASAIEDRVLDDIALLGLDGEEAERFADAERSTLGYVLADLHDRAEDLGAPPARLQ